MEVLLLQACFEEDKRLVCIWCEDVANKGRRHVEEFEG